jgi:heavy metal sensor kinase
VVRRSIRLTLTLWNALTLAVILVLFSVMVYMTLSKHLYAEYDREMGRLAESIANPALAPFWDTPQSAFDQVLEDFLGDRAEGHYIQITLPSGETGARTLNLGEAVLPLEGHQKAKAASGDTVYATLSKGVDGTPLRMGIYPAFSNGEHIGVIQLATPLTDAMATLDNVRLVFAISIPLILIVIACGSWLLTLKALRPVEVLTTTARRISAENLSERIAIANPADEIGQLTSTMNDMLDRLETSFTRVRQFSSDVSHELRTPLTIMRGEMEVAARWARDVGECRTIMGSCLEEVDRMTGIIEHLLELARVEEGHLALEFREVDLATVVEQALAHEKGRMGAGGVTIYRPEEDAVIRGDDRLLRMVFIALLDNAFRFSPPDQAVEVRITNDGGRAVVDVADRGPGIAPSEQQRIFDRFYRSDASRNRSQGGAGLGLSLARSIVEAHGGTVSVDSTLGQGSTFTVALPLIPPTAAAP